MKIACDAIFVDPTSIFEYYSFKAILSIPLVFILLQKKTVARANVRIDANRAQNVAFEIDSNQGRTVKERLYFFISFSMAQTNVFGLPNQTFHKLYVRKS